MAFLFIHNLSCGTLQAELRLKWANEARNSFHKYQQSDQSLKSNQVFQVCLNVSQNYDQFSKISMFLKFQFNDEKRTVCRFIESILIFFVFFLDFFMNFFVNFSFQYFVQKDFVVFGHFENLCCVNSVILLMTHHMNLINDEFVHRSLMQNFK